MCVRAIPRKNVKMTLSRAHKPESLEEFRLRENEESSRLSTVQYRDICICGGSGTCLICKGPIAQPIINTFHNSPPSW
jgi:hypothetical protein